MPDTIEEQVLTGKEYHDAGPLTETGPLYVFPGFAYHYDEDLDYYRSVSGSNLEHLPSSGGERYSETFFVTASAVFLPTHDPRKIQMCDFVINGDMYQPPSQVVSNSGDPLYLFDPYSTSNDRLVMDKEDFTQKVESGDIPGLFRVDYAAHR